MSALYKIHQLPHTSFVSEIDTQPSRINTYVNCSLTDRTMIIIILCGIRCIICLPCACTASIHKYKTAGTVLLNFGKISQLHPTLFMRISCPKYYICYLKACQIRNSSNCLANLLISQLFFHIFRYSWSIYFLFDIKAVIPPLAMLTHPAHCSDNKQTVPDLPSLHLSPVILIFTFNTIWGVV